MKLSILSVFMVLLGAASANATPRDTDCPLVHPDDSKLKLVSATLDQHTDGPPPPPDRDEAIKLPDGTIRIITHYASYRIYRDAILICAYSELRNRQVVHIDEKNSLRLMLPGILMRCDGIKRERKMPEVDDWKRRWCVHEPDL